MSYKKQKKSPILIPEHVWDKYFDPIDKEIYEVLEQRFPLGYASEELLKILISIDPEENEEYTLQDVWDALDISLKDYVIKKGKGFWTLKPGNTKALY